MGPLHVLYFVCNDIDLMLVRCARLVGGGSGAVPLMSMIRHSRSHDFKGEIALAISAKTVDKIPYKRELDGYAKDGLRVLYFVTREVVEGDSMHSGRLDLPFLKQHFGGLLDPTPVIYVCGQNPFVEAVVADLIAIGFSSQLDQD